MSPRSVWLGPLLAIVALAIVLALVVDSRAGAGLALLAGAWVLAVGIGAVVYTRWRDVDRIRAVLRLSRPGRAGARDPWAFVVETIRELDERIAELEARRRESEAVLSTLQDGVIALDAEQRVLAMNRAAQRMLSATANFNRGRLLQEVARQPSLNAFVADAMRQTHGGVEEFELIGSTSMRVRAAASSLDTGEGAERGLLVVMTDVTRLRRLETMRSEFAANAAHELRTPITNIMGYVETLQDTGWDDRELARDCLETISKHAGRLGAIIDDMLALTRLESPEGREGIDAFPSRIGEILDAAWVELSDEADRKGVQVVVEGNRDLRAMVNPALVQQAITNLLSNAIRYSPSGTTVTIRVHDEPADSDTSLVQVEVYDEGPGIAPEHLPRIFERFYRVDKARSRQLGGTGLGLAIVKHIALVHGGGVDVQSSVGKGSRFRLTLPGG